MQGDVCQKFRVYDYDANFQKVYSHSDLVCQDFHPGDGNQFVSAGMDNTVKIWNMEGMSFRRFSLD